MAAPISNMFRLIARFRMRKQGMELETNKLHAFAIMRFKRKLVTVTNYETTVDDSLSELTSFRKHPGIMRPKHIKLPEVLLQNINRYLADKPVKQLRPHATALGNYLWSRNRPLEESDLRAKAQEYAVMHGVEDIDEEMLYSQDLPKDRKKKIASVMNTLRRHVYHWKPITYDETTACVYMMSRAAANFAATYRVFYEIKKRIPDFTPQAMLDFGSGIGTATWAAHTIWGDSIKEFYCVDTSRPMHDAAGALMREGTAEDEMETAVIKGVYFRHFLPMSLQKTYDLTVSAYSLLELPSKSDRLTTLQTLWHKTDQFLILIECGTNEGYKTILEARDYILRDLGRKVGRHKHRGSIAKVNAKDMTREEMGLAESPGAVVGHVFAPCQHDLACPRRTDGSSNPCNFDQDFHDFTNKGHSSESSTERFCYLVLRKGPRKLDDSDYHWPRIIRPVLPRSRHVICRLCCPNGQLEDTVITRAKHGRELYRCARHSRWGDLLPISRPKVNSDLAEETDSEGDRSGND